MSKKCLVGLLQELTMKLGSGNDAYTFNKMTLTGSYANPAYETTEVTTQRTESTFETRRSALRTSSANGHRPVSIPEVIVCSQIQLKIALNSLFLAAVLQIYKDFCGYIVVVCKSKKTIPNQIQNRFCLILKVRIILSVFNYYDFKSIQNIESNVKVTCRTVVCTLKAIDYCVIL